MPAVCLLILAVGIPLWVSYSYSAVATTSETLSAADMDTGALHSALGALGLLRTVVLVLAVVMFAAVLALAVAHTLREKRSRGRGMCPSTATSFLAADAATSLLLWVVMTGAVVLVALTATWFLGSMAIDGLLNMATRYSADAEKAANRAVASSQGLIDQLRAVQLAALDAAPQEVKNNTWYQQYREGVNNFNQTVNVAAKTPSSDNCKPGCISLNFLAGLAGLDSTCICLTNTINHVQQGLHATQQSTMQSLVGLGLVYLATSWLLMWCVGTCTSTRRDLQDYRRLAKSSSTGEGLGGSGFSSGSSAGSAADAAIEIHSTDSPMAAHKAASTAVLPRGGAAVHHADRPFMIHNAAADVRGERDAAPRLPYV